MRKLIKQYQLLSLCSCYTIIFIHTSPHVSMYASAMPCEQSLWRIFLRISGAASGDWAWIIWILPAKFPSFIIPGTSILTAWWCNFTILKNDGVSQWGWDDIPYIMENKKCFETTNQLILENTLREFGRAGKSNMAWKITRFIGSFPIGASTFLGDFPATRRLFMPFPAWWMVTLRAASAKPCKGSCLCFSCVVAFHGVLMDLWIFQLGFNGV